MKQPSKSVFSLSGYDKDKDLPEILSVTSGKGGVGKTIISVNLAILLRQYKKKILLVDADIHLGNVDLVLGIRPKYTIADVVVGDMDLRNIIVKCPQGIDVLPAASAIQDLFEMERNILKKLCDSFSGFEREYDVIVVDTGAGISKSVMSFVLGSDKVIIMVTPDPASITDAYGMIKVIKQFHPFVPILMIVNMVDSQDDGESLYKKLELMAHKFLNNSIVYGGTILKDKLISDSIRRQRPLVLEHPNSMPTNTLKIIIRRLLQLPCKDNNKHTGFFDSFMSHRNIIIGDSG
ncbi:MAG: MinD/ParA family protein [Candidatus Marinimicrobia bacterium]|nr:MinD/ParA family protein [Candidatus Neomarinimicrobiota bacterium]